MLASEIIEKIKQKIEDIPSGSLEIVYQSALATLLGEMGLHPERRRTETGGVPDFFVGDSEPPLLIEIKQSGDWRCVGEAAAQLWSYSVGLPSITQKIAVFGGPLVHESHKGMLESLNIRYIVRGG